MDKRTIIAIILTIAVIFLWSLIQSKFFPPPSSPPPTQETKEKEVLPSQKEIEKVERLKEETVQKGKALPAVKGVPKKEVTVETKDYTAVFTSEGAKLKQFKLKKYHNRVVESPIAIKLIQFVDSLLGKKSVEPKEPHLLELVDTTEEEGLPLGLSVGSPPSSENWEVENGHLRLLGENEKGSVTFVNNFQNGLRIAKRFGFNSENYAMDLEVEVRNTTTKEIPVHVGLEWVGRVELKKLAEGDKDFGLKYAFLKNQKVERKEFGRSGSSGCTPMGCGAVKTKIEPFEIAESGQIEWFSFGGEYFTTMMIPIAPKGPMAIKVKGDEKDIVKADLVSPQVSLAPNETMKIPYKVYLGPKEVSQLKALGSNADKLIDFGWFTIVAKPLLWFLNFTHRATSNYGIDIIILSILIKVIFLPLTQISFKSMKEMQKVQPEMTRLKETYKNDKARLQQEIMLLYKRRKINPMSGCLPMVIQIPVFIALYNVLQNTFEMRHAPFMLWIRDLSAKDPIYITPIIMGATMVIQQKMTPSMGDPSQAKMMMLMPIMFTFLFLNFPSGLVLYWLVNNVLSIAHQYYLNRKT